MNWSLKNKTTGEIVGEKYNSFESLCYNEIDPLFKEWKEEIVTHSDTFLKERVNRLRTANEVLEFDLIGTNGLSNANIWNNYLKSQTITFLLNHKFDRSTVTDYLRLIARLGDSISNKFIVLVSTDVDIAQLGLVYISAKMFDPGLVEDLIIITEDQLNYIKLVYEEKTLKHVTDVNKVLTYLKDLDL